MSQVQGFDYTKSLLQDLMHNLLEGVADVCIRALLSFLIENCNLSLETLNSKLQTFPYPKEMVKDKPSIISPQHLTAHLRQKAAQMMCLLCVLPFVLAPFENDTNREHLLNFTLLVQITHRLLAYEVDHSSISTLKFMILTHHSTYRNLYPDAAFTPKFHFLVHSPSTISNFGPCRVSWCMRFEAMNAWFAQAAGQTNNFINITKSLTRRFQIRRCLDFGLGDGKISVLGKKLFAPTFSTIVDLEHYEMGPQIAQSLQIALRSRVDAASSIFVKNFEIKQGTVLLYDDSHSGLPVFAEVTAIFVREQTAVFSINILDTIYFDHMRCAYEINKTNMFTCKKADDFKSLQPFPRVETATSSYVVPMYYDAKVFVG